MKYLITIILSVLALTANAQHYHGNHRHHHGHYQQYNGNAWGWVAPAIITGAIVYGVTRPAPQPQVIYAPQALPPAPYGFRYEQILDANCNCYRWVLIQG
jgi:hypothetical protein